MVPARKSGISVLDSRTAWAITYLTQAGLIRRPKRAVNQITKRDLQVLQDHPDRVDNQILVQFEEFRELSPAREPLKGVQYVRGRRAVVAIVDLNAAATEAPRETITAAIEENNAAVAADISTRVREQDPAFLENLVLKGLTAGATAAPSAQPNDLGGPAMKDLMARKPIEGSSSR